MGKGDIRSRRGKIWRGTYGVSRPQNRKRKAPRPAVVSRKAKSLKDLPKVVAEPVVKKQVTETIQPQVTVKHEPTVEKVQPTVVNAVVEAPVVSEVPAVTTAAEPAVKKAPAAKKPTAKKTSVAKKPAAKKAPAKKKK